MKRPLSLTLRLTLLFGTAITIGLLVFGWVVERSIEHHFKAQDIGELKVVTRAVEHAIATTAAETGLAGISQRFDDILVGHHNASLYITDARGRPVYVSRGADLAKLPPPPEKDLSQGVVQQWHDGQHSYRVYRRLVFPLVETPSEQFLISVAVNTDFHILFLQRFHRSLWATVAIAIAVMAVMGWIAVRQGHKPLHRVVEQISRISASELNTRIDPDTVPVEIRELALSFNELLQRLEEAFNRLSNFTADIAHELRTPVSNLMTQTQVALSQARSEEEYREILYSNMEEYERMAQMIGDMLFLAKADNGQGLAHIEEIDLAKEVKKLFDFYEAWAEEQQVGLVLEGSARVEGDRTMLQRVMSNLLSNAIRHTPARQQVTVRLRPGGEEVEIAVKNPGEPLAAEHLDHIFDRFYRVDPSRQRGSEGAGLGLAIAQSIVQAHGGKLRAASDANSTRFTATLPRRQSSAALV